MKRAAPGRELPHLDSQITSVAGGLGGRALARNAGLNLLGQAAPMAVAVVAIPLLIARLGTERFGVLSLAWMVIGYFSLFDLGLGRALTQLVAEKLGAGRAVEVPELAWTGSVLIWLLGLVGGVLLALLSPWLVRELLQVPVALQSETLGSFQVLALSLPWVVSTAGLRGILEAYQRFDLVTWIRLPMGVFTFAGPLLVLPFSASLVPIVSVLVLGRVVAWGAHLLLCLRASPGLRTPPQFVRSRIAPMLRIGGWMTVSNVVSPLMVYLDRFLIGALLSMSAVAFYVTPYEVVTKLWVVPSALVGVLYPAIAASFVENRSNAVVLLDRGVRFVFLVIFPAALVLVALGKEGLGVWLGEEFASNSTAVLQWLAAGIMLNSIGQVAFAAVQGGGRPDLTGKLHLMQLPLYLVALWWLVAAWGIRGAAVAWTARVALDTALLLVLVRRVLPAAGEAVRRGATLSVLGSTVLAAAAVLPSTAARASFLIVVLLAFGVAAWRWLILPAERAELRRHAPLFGRGAATRA